MKKYALITGACINTGVAIVEKFASEGWNVVFGDNRQYTGSKAPLSIDSRTFGLVHESQIFGVAKYEIESFFNWKKIGE